MIRCWLWFPWEITILKAIHNNKSNFSKQRFAVISMGNYHFESNSQHPINDYDQKSSCDFHGKLPFWKQFTTQLKLSSPALLLWFPWEITILKAIHNLCFFHHSYMQAVISMGNYHFESNSQPAIPSSCKTIGCDFHGKLPFWKQFTTQVIE